MAKAKRQSPLQSYLEVHTITSFREVLDAVDDVMPRPAPTADRDVKKNYAQRYSEAAAVLMARELRNFFPEVIPNPDGTGGESAARTGKGVKKLDVNYSTTQLGLGLGVSIKTLNFRDAGSKRYTKNATRIDNELRAEAMDYHDRQPFAVLVAIVLLPADACDDGDPRRKRSSSSSFAHFVSVLRHRVGRSSPRNESQLFEKGFIGLYHHDGKQRGRVDFFELMATPPQFGPPAQFYDLAGVISLIVNTYDDRNRVKRPWEEKSDEAVPFSKLVEEERLPPDEDDGEENV